MKAVVLLSGGVDSSVVLAMALQKGRTCHALSFDYGQRHRIELERAEAIAKHYSVPHQVISIDVSAFGKSSLVTSTEPPKHRTAQQIEKGGIPNTYVPARNTLFIAYALAQAEILEAQEIYVGANQMDALPYPDCRPEYFQAFQSMINVATKQAIEGRAPQLVAPLLVLNKTQIIREGVLLGVPLEKTWSCYDPKLGGVPCGCCDACVLRQSAFLEVGVGEGEGVGVKVQ